MAAATLPQGDLPAWSPDGHVVYVSSAAADHGNLWIADPTTQTGRVLVSDAGPGNFSPQGDLLALAGVERLTIARPDGTIVRRIPLNLTSPEDVGVPAWSPDGRRLAVSVGGIFVGRFGQRAWKRVTRNGGEFFQLAWSPNGHMIVFTRGSYRFEGDSLEIGVVDAAGHAERAVANGELPVWGPHGKLIAYAANIAYPLYIGGRGVYIVRPDGHGRRCLANPPGEEVALAWSADGRHLVIASKTHESVALYAVEVTGRGLHGVGRDELREFAPLSGDPAFAKNGRGFAQLAGAEGRAEVKVVSTGPTHILRASRRGCPPPSAVAAELPNTGAAGFWLAAAGLAMMVVGVLLRRSSPRS